MRFFLRYIAFLFVFCFAGLTGARGDTFVLRSLSAAQYAQALAPVGSAAVRAASGNTSAATQAMHDLAPLLRCVVLQRGSLIYVDNRPIMAAMQGAELITDAGKHKAAWADIAHQVENIRADSIAPVLPNRIDAKAAAITILSTKEFSSQPLPGKSIWEKFGDWVERMFAKLHLHPFHSSMGMPEHISPVIPDIILIVLIVVALGLVIYFTLLWWRGRAKGAMDEVHRSDLALTLEEQELVASHNYAGLRALAADASGRGDYRSAFRLAFLAILVYLDAEGAIKLDRSKTNWEYLRALSGETELRSRLAPLVRDFDRIWYGEGIADQADFEQANAAFDSIRAAMTEYAPSANLQGASQT